MAHAHWPVIVSATSSGRRFCLTKIFEVIGKREHEILLQYLALRIGDLCTGYRTADALVLFQQIEYR